MTAGIGDTEFAARLDRLGPFEPSPRLAVGVSGGPDSMALAVLAHAWARARGGAVLALIVDHGLRTGSAAEAAETRARLDALGVAATILTLSGLRDGRREDAPMAVVARDARYRCMIAATRDAGIVHLLVGHHAGDQDETRVLRARAGSGAAGLAGMAGVRETEHARLLRPLLDVRPDRLRAVLRARGIGWIDDPSNRDPRTRRARVRTELGGAAADLPDDAGTARAALDIEVAAELAARVMLSPLGYAVVSPGAIGAACLAAAWQAISGRAYPPPRAALAALAADPAAATLAGARLLPAGRLGPGWLLVRDGPPPPPAPARHGGPWDRFVLHAPDLPLGLVIGAAGDVAGARHLPPAVIRRLLPALFRDGRRVAVPSLGLGEDVGWFRFVPSHPAAGAPFGVCAPDDVVSLPFRDA